MATAFEKAGSLAPIQRGAGGAALREAAREVFAERGYHGASIRDIAKRAGLSLSALYYWYASKQELFAALLEDSVQDYFETCDAALREAADTPQDRLRVLVQATVDYRVRRRLESIIATREILNLEPAQANRLVELRRAATDLFRDVIADGIRQGVFDCEHPDDSRRSLEAACNAIADWYDPAGEITADQLADRYADIALRLVGYTRNVQ
ncbi:TetR family transcriptional regulator [Tamaricihabitans halophyticus]|uniref:TetR family transcriptional regulator n=1 Tax=Tamaricihabitans halophyticus TaxID=1262583 RepID=A0A4R2QKV0_9PSEU|nr:TetR/AcrR family transcriptional regulator [Tamaricihabitans halophyticus]TCP50082.1 TetR family transcriptional regulator [Tamaricihabitans halophyticus]